MATVPYRKPANSPPSDFDDRPLPRNVEAERTILGAILLDNTSILAATAKIKPEDFSLAEHRHIFSAMIALDVAGKPLDTIHLMEQLTAVGKLESAGGVAYLSTLADGIPRVTNVPHYAALVAEKSRLRQIIETAHAIESRAMSDGADSAYITADLAEYAKRIKLGSAPALRMVDFHEFIKMELPPREFVIEPLLALREQMMIYSPRGAGKTWMTLQLGFDIAAGYANSFMWYIPKPRPVVYVDGEMSVEELQERERIIGRIRGEDRWPEAGFLQIIARDLQTEMRPRINTREGRQRIGDCLSPGDTVVFDNLASLGQSSDDKETENWAEMQDWFSDLCWNGMSVILIHHAGKSGSQRGTSKREDLLSSVINLKLPSDYNPDQGLRLHVVNEKKRGKIRVPSFVQPFEVMLTVDASTGRQEWVQRPLRALLKEEARKMLQEGMKPNDVAQDTGLHRRSVYRILQKMKTGDTSIDPD